MENVDLLTGGFSLSWSGVFLALTAPVLTIWTGFAIATAVRRRRRIAARNRDLIEAVNRQKRLPKPLPGLPSPPRLLPPPEEDRRKLKGDGIHIRTRVRWIPEWRRYHRFSTVEEVDRD